MSKRRTLLSLPRGWTKRIRSAVLHAISLAKYAVVSARGDAADSPARRVRRLAELDRLQQEVALLQEEIRIKDGRMSQIAPHKRPFYSPTDRLAILELRAARGWSLQKAADTFQITAATLSSWMKRLDETGENALVQMPVPVNKFPEFVRYLVQRIKTLCPTMGKVKIAQTLARAGLHLGSTTVGRILDESPVPPNAAVKQGVERVVTAKHPDNVWHVDLTPVPTDGGFWTPWCPGALPQVWPFCWWIAVALDHFSRRVIGVVVFRWPPTSADIRAFLGRTMAAVAKTPKYLICDKGSQFWCDKFKAWCKRRGIRPRYGKVNEHGSLAVIERFILTLKTEGLRGLLIPFRRETFRRDLLSFVAWYNGFRPHTTLGGRTPDEVYHGLAPANEAERVEPRTRWPRGSPCARPRTPVRGDPGTTVELVVQFHDGQRHLPVITLKRAA